MKAKKKDIRALSREEIRDFFQNTVEQATIKTSLYFSPFINAINWS
jgi:ribosomal protein L29